MLDTYVNMDTGIPNVDGYLFIVLLHLRYTHTLDESAEELGELLTVRLILQAADRLVLKHEHLREKVVILFGTP